MPETPKSELDLNTTEERNPFGFTLDDLEADAASAVENPLVRAAILRVKHGQVEQGFNHGYDKAYHSHSRT